MMERRSQPRLDKYRFEWQTVDSWSKEDDTCIRAASLVLVKHAITGDQLSALRLTRSGGFSLRDISARR